MTCTEVRDILSDLIDVRNGEIPPVGVSRLSQPEIRADAESHLAACTDCRAELVILEEVGSVFSDFNVGELPTQHFSNYGQIVRDRMAKTAERKIVPIRAAGMNRWWKVGASTAAAACLAFAVMHFMPKKHTTSSTGAVPARFASAARPYTPIPTSSSPTPMDVYNVGIGLGQSNRERIYNPDQPKQVLDELTHDESKYGFVILGEKVPTGESPLLGVMLKTTRDEDRDVSKKGSFGLKVFDIVQDSVANEMGLMKNDTIVCINGQNVNSGSVEDAVRFLTIVHNLGKSAMITVDIVRQDQSGVLYIQRRGVLGEPKAIVQ